MTQQPPKTYQQPISITQGQKVSLFKEVTNRFWKKNWWLVVLYVLACLAGAYVSSYLGLSAAASFWASVVFSAVETVLGLYAVVQVIRITKEVPA
jgi:FtsH-binding integral membrane protein